MTDRERNLMDGLVAFGWAIADPWSAEKGNGSWTVVDAGPMCNVCGQAAPETQEWPTGDSFRDPNNHAPDCALASLLRENGG